MTPSVILSPILWIIRLLACSFPLAVGSLQTLRAQERGITDWLGSRAGRIGSLALCQVRQESARRP